MVLIVENGTGVNGADSYNSLAEANQYVQNYVCRDSVRAAWDALDDIGKERVLRAGAFRLDSCYYTRWRGEPTTPTQGLYHPMTVPSSGSCWDPCPDPCLPVCDRPRTLPEGSLGLPQAIKYASIEMALRCMADQQATSGTTGTIGAIQEETSKICEFEKTTKYYAPTAETIQQLEATDAVDPVEKLVQPYICEEQKGKFGGRLIV